MKFTVIMILIAVAACQEHRVRSRVRQLLPIQELQERLTDLDPDTDYLVTCEHGMRSLAACEFLTSMGFQKLTDLSGGMAHWIGEGLPVEQG